MEAMIWSANAYLQFRSFLPGDESSVSNYKRTLQHRREQSIQIEGNTSRLTQPGASFS